MSKLHSFLVSCMRTQYRIEVPGQEPIVLRIGSTSRAVDHLLTSVRVDVYGYLTAYNPQSTSLSDAENRQRHDRLCREIRRRGYVYFAGQAVPEWEAWDPETCVFVPGMPRSEVLAVCAAFDQDGAVVGEVGSAPKLLFTNPALRRDFSVLLSSCVLE